MTAPTESETSQCWCCGSADASDRMIHLGDHPEVALCVGCAHWAHLQGREIADRDRTGLAVRGRDVLRGGRRVVIERGWHRRPVVGGLLRRLGRYLP